jgi:hypothetical protein
MFFLYAKLITSQIKHSLSIRLSHSPLTLVTLTFSIDPKSGPMFFTLHPLSNVKLACVSLELPFSKSLIIQVLPFVYSAHRDLYTF